MLSVIAGEEVEDLLRAMEKSEKLFVYSDSSIGFSKPGYRKHKVENSQGTVRGGTLMSSVKKLVNPNRRRVNELLCRRGVGENKSSSKRLMI